MDHPINTLGNSNVVDTTSNPIARRAVNTAKTALREGKDPIDAVQKALDAIEQPSMFWSEDDSEGVRIGDFNGAMDLVLYSDGREPQVVLNPNHKGATPCTS